MAYKLLALDLDGTLLSEDKTVSSRNQKAIIAASARGVTVVIASGRIYPEARRAVEGVRGLSLISACNGALAFDLRTGVALASRPLPEDLALRVCETLSGTGIFFMVYAEEVVYVDRATLASYEPYARYIEGATAEHHFMDDFRADRRFSGATKLKIYAGSPDPALLGRARALVAAFPGLEVTSSHATNIEITAAGVDKGTGLREIGAARGIGLDEMVAIGDSENDLAMLRAVGLPIAMGNATQAVKAMAKAHTASNREDGVALAIEAHLLA